MIRHVIGLGVLFLTALVSAQQARVPNQFHGKWAGTESECGQTSESSLAIAEDRIDFYESRGRVLSVKSSGELEIEVELESRGERQVWRWTRRFKLSEDGQTLTDVTMDKYHFARTRCK